MDHPWACEPRKGSGLAKSWRVAAGSLAALAVALACAAPLVAADPPAPPPGTLRIESAVVTLIEEVEIPARTPGVVIDVLTEEGMQVARGELLLRIDDAEAALDLELAEADAAAAELEAANLLAEQAALKAAEVARAELKRSTESAEKYNRAVSQTELDRLRLAAEQAELQAQQARHVRRVAELAAERKQTEVRAAQARVARHRVESPIDGVVVEVRRHLGEWVEPGAAVVRVVRVDPLRVEGFVPAAALAAPLVGRRATLLVDLPDEPGARIEGVVTLVSPEADAVTGQVRVWAEVPNPERRLRPGLTGTLEIMPAAPRIAEPGKEPSR